MVHHPSQLDNFTKKIPDGDNRDRLVCGDCGLIHYENPRIVVGSVVTYENKFLLCKRAIEPRHGYWTLPAGFMEERETTEEGARREAEEEACINITIEALLAVYNIPRISQVQLIYKAHLKTPDYAPGPESLDVELFTWDDIPWNELAFPSVYWALNQYLEVADKSVFAPFGNPEGDMGNMIPKRN
ncbi:MAG: NUDIX hydrolase [Proteobacteria bacterium]|jgi:ADP-ribose pyrophosphatase YjhB (NUDIX family)|nr:NUDIX hydrolase [Pseudomonadota bacterium]